MQNVDDLYGGGFQLSFDSSVAQVQDANPHEDGVQIESGSWLQRQLEADNTVDNTLGTIGFFVTQRHPEEPKDGSGILARIAGVTETQVAAIKHRSLRRIRQAVAGDPSDGSDLPREDSLLTEIWETQRLSCPKRSTIGAYLLGTLDRPWEDYVRFHLDELGCRFCQANLTDLRRQTAGPKRSTLHTRIMESTIGFLRKT